MIQYLKRSARAAALVLVAHSSTAAADINFTNVTANAIGDYSGETWGVSVGDMNGDFWPDIYTGNHRERPSLYRNNANGTFTDILLTADIDRCFLDSRYMDDHGGAWSDFDSDGDDDLLIMGHGCSGINWSPRLFKSNGLDRLANVSAQYGLGLNGQQRSSMAIAWLDFNQDGVLDTFESANGTGAIDAVRSGAGAPPFGPQITVPNCYHSHAALLVDVDGGDDTEVMCLREGSFPYGMFAQTPGGLVDVSGSVSMPGTGNVVDAVAEDFDGDLDTDLFMVRGSIIKNKAKAVASNRVDAQLDASPSSPEVGFKFKGGGVVTLTIYGAYQTYTFQRGTGPYGPPNGPATRRVPIELDPNDFLNEGIFPNRTGRRIWTGYDPATDEWTFLVTGTDYYIGVYLTVEGTAPITDVQEIGMLARDGEMRPQLWHRENAGNWSNQTWQSGFVSDIDCAGVVSADFDNDMDLDIYAICQNGVENLANQLYENDGNGVFTKVPGAGGAAGPVGPAFVQPDPKGWGEAAVTGDFNNDGFIDLFISNGFNNYPTRHKSGPHQLFQNAGNSNHWIELELEGTQSNPDGLGARVIATAGGVSQLRVQNGGYHRWSQNHQRIHFGLAGNTSVNLEIKWPSGLNETFNNIAADKLYQVVEGSGLSVVTPSSAQPGFTPAVAGDECGAPRPDFDRDRGAFLSKNCGSGEWTLQVTGGGRSTGSPYQGTIVSSAPFAKTGQSSIEGNDVYTGSGSASHAFNLVTSGIGVDTVKFTPVAGSTTCFSVSLPGDAMLFLGPDHIPVSSPIDLNTLGSCQGGGTPTLSVQPLTVDEGVGTANVAVTLSSPATSPVSVVLATQAGTASGGSDFYGTSRTLNFAAGETTRTAAVTIIDDGAPESNESFTVRLFSPSGATIGASTAQVTITDNDTGVATLSVNPVSVNESDGSVDVAVTLSSPVSNTVTVKFSTQSQTATGGSDFFGKFQQLSFPAGTTSRTVTVTLVNDAVAESQESFIARIFGATGAGISNAQANVTINDDDAGVSSLSVLPTSVSESAGSVNVVVTLSPASSSAVSVKFATSSQTASGGSDFYGKSTTVNFAPGQTSKSVSVTIVNDQVAESTETFRARLFAPTGASIGSSQANVTINDDD